MSGDAQAGSRGRVVAGRPALEATVGNGELRLSECSPLACPHIGSPKKRDKACPQRRLFHKGFGTSPNRLPSTDEIIEVIDHLIPHFLFKVRGAKESLIVVIVPVLSVLDSIP